MYGRKGERTFMAYRRTEVFSPPEKCLQRPWKKAVPEFKKTMEQRFQIPCEVENDVKSAICTFRERNSRTWEPAALW